MLSKCLVDINVLVYFGCVGMQKYCLDKERALDCCIIVVVHNGKV